MKRLFFIILAVLLLCLSVTAEEPKEDFLDEQYKNSGADILPDLLDEGTRDILKSENISPDNAEGILNLTPQTVFEHIIDFVKGGAATPLAAGGTVIGVILISAALSANSDGAAQKYAAYAVTTASAAVICIPLFSVITASAKALRSAAFFMTGFVPVFALLTTASGKGATAIASESVLLLAAEGVTFAADFVVVPLMSGYIAISIASGVSPMLAKSGIADGIKRISLWIMSLITTVFIGILSIKTAVGAAEDTLGLKTAKFLLGTTVPIAGTALAEALTTLTASIGTLKATVGIYGVIGCACCFLPLLAEILIWKLVLLIGGSIGELFGTQTLPSLLRSLDSALSVLVAILLLTAVLFTISLSIICSVGK